MRPGRSSARNGRTSTPGSVDFNCSGSSGAWRAGWSVPSVSACSEVCASPCLKMSLRKPGMPRTSTISTTHAATGSSQASSLGTRFFAFGGCCSPFCTDFVSGASAVLSSWRFGSLRRTIRLSAPQCGQRTLWPSLAVVVPKRFPQDLQVNVRDMVKNSLGENTFKIHRSWATVQGIVPRLCQP